MRLLQGHPTAAAKLRRLFASLTPHATGSLPGLRRAPTARPARARRARVALAEEQPDVHQQLVVTAAASPPPPSPSPSPSSLAHEHTTAATTTTATTTAAAADADFADDTELPEELAAVVPEKPDVPHDLLQLVTGELHHIKERELQRRRDILFELTHPRLQDYTFAGKLVPPPPLAFGRLTEEGQRLGQQMFVEQCYSLVNQAAPDDYFFEINDLYLEVAFLGKANAGKSSLINALTQQEVAKTSSQPNCTRTINFFQSASPEEIRKFAGRNPSKLVKLPAGGLQLTLVDVPGFGIPGMSDKWRDHAIRLTDAYLGVRRSLNTVFLCIDAVRGVTKGDERYFSWIENLHGMFYVVLTKCDAVPHQRLCTVMRQIYQLMTRHRRKHRKAFPFVLPVSAHAGINIAELRAMIVETSGLIAGDKMRDLLLRQRAQEQRAMLREEEQRLESRWCEQRTSAKRAFLESRGLLPPPPESTGGSSGSLKEKTAGGAFSGDRTGLSPGKSAPLRRRKVVLLPEAPATKASSQDPTRWGETLNYGMWLRLNAGLDPVPASIEIGGADTAEGSNSTAATAATDVAAAQLVDAAGGVAGVGNATAEAPRSSGAVSEFLDALNEQLDSPDPEPKRPSLRKREATFRRLAQQLKRGTHVLAGEDDGTLRELRCGRPMGARMTQIGVVSSRFNALSTRRFIETAVANSAERTQPWRAVRSAVKRMAPKELRAFAKNAGAVEAGKEKFQQSVAHRKWLKESRFVETKFKQEELHVSGATRVSFGSQPPGLLKRYAEQEKYWQVDSVIGLPSSHRT